MSVVGIFGLRGHGGTSLTLCTSNDYNQHWDHEKFVYSKSEPYAENWFVEVCMVFIYLIRILQL